MTRPDRGARVGAPRTEKTRIPRPGRPRCGTRSGADFDPERAAVYYARVVENPTCRWTTWQCLSLPPEARPDGCSDPRVPRTIQERAWTSPIGYVPDG